MLCTYGEAAGGFLRRALLARSASLSRLLLGTFLAETRKVPLRRMQCYEFAGSRSKNIMCYRRALDKRPYIHASRLCVKLQFVFPLYHFSAAKQP